MKEDEVRIYPPYKEQTKPHYKICNCPSVPWPHTKLVIQETKRGYYVDDRVYPQFRSEIIDNRKATA